jgi:D-alanyl-D-alanine carboxypeptidase
MFLRIVAVMQIIRLVFVLMSLSALVAFGAPEAQAKAKKKADAQDQKFASIVIDYQTGDVLSATNPDRQLHPASLTKIMTLLLTFEAIDRGQLKRSDYIRVSSHAASMSPSKLGIRPGGKIRLEDAIRAVAVKSANDMAAALAEAVAGTESRFAQLMNARAKEIGMTRTRFVNASGLHHAFQVSTARDMARLGRYMIAKHPSDYRYFGLKSFSYGGRNHPNHNRLMNTYSGMDGMKTGFISQSGFNLVASAKRGDRRLMGVVFGGRTTAARNKEMARLLDLAFAGKGTRPAPDTMMARMDAESESEKISSDDVGMVIPTPPDLPDRRVGEQLAKIMPASAPIERVQVALSSGKQITTLPPQVSKYRPPAGTKTPLSSWSSSKTINDQMWSVQIGAYQDRDATDRALYSAMKQLPSTLAHASPVVAPYKSLEEGWLFRARLGNLDADQARQACALLKGCLVLAPDQH